MNKNKGKDFKNRNNSSVRREKENRPQNKATAADIQKLKEHFDKKFGRN